MEEAVRSETAAARGIDNTPSGECCRHIEETIDTCLDPLREAWGCHCGQQGWNPAGIRISSGYRCQALNTAVGGSATSAHCLGYAFDLVPLNGRMREFRQFCRDWFRTHPFDQLISEAEDARGVPRWLHVGFRDGTGRQRREMLVMRGGRYFPMTD